jgi:hypothetical protein
MLWLYSGQCISIGEQRHPTSSGQKWNLTWSFDTHRQHYNSFSLAQQSQAQRLSYAHNIPVGININEPSSFRGDLIAVAVVVIVLG